MFTRGASASLSPLIHTCFLFIACAPAPKASSSSELCCCPGTDICLQNFSSCLRWVEEMLQEPLPSAALLRQGGSLLLELLNRLRGEDLGASQTLFLPHAQASLGTHAWACCRPQGTPRVSWKAVPGRRAGGSTERGASDLHRTLRAIPPPAPVCA